MGYGGALIWTGLTRNLKKKFPNKQIVLVYKPNIKNILLGRKNTDLEIYKNNPDILLVSNKIFWTFFSFFYNKNRLVIIDMEQEKYHYWISDSKEKMCYKQQGHAISIACDPFNLKSVILKTRLILKDDESKEVEQLLFKNKLVNTKYICIEPNSKNTFTNNKQWPLDHWQKLIDLSNNWITEKQLDYKIVQIGVKGSPLLKGVVDMVGTTSFRQLKKIIEGASLVVANEGGVGHLTASCKTRAVIICNPSLPPQLMTYPQNINILPKKNVHNCGLKTPCPVCQELLISIKPDYVFGKIKDILR